MPWYCRFSAHHWAGFPVALEEARRVLKPGGRAVFADAVSPGVGFEVYRVKVSVNNASGVLKPGMPVEAEIQLQQSTTGR